MRMAARTPPPAAASNSAARAPGNAGCLRDDAARAVGQLGVGGLDVDHQVAVNVAHTDERPRGEHVEDQFLRGAGLHARATRR